MAPWGIDHPWLLAAGATVGLVLAALSWKRGPRARWGGLAAAGTALLLSAGAAGPWMREQLPEQRLLVLAVDVSDSIDAAEAARAAQLVRSAWQAAAPARRAVLAFGADAAVVVRPGDNLPSDLGAALAAAPVARHTSRLEPVLGLAATMRRRGEPAHCVLYSDGALAWDDPRPPAMPVSAVPLDPPLRENAVVAQALDGPDVAETGAPIALTLRYHALAPVKAEVVVTDGADGKPGDEVLSRTRQTLQGGGPHLLALPALLLSAGAHVLTATVRVPDPHPEDNRALLALEVLDPPPVAVVTREPESTGAQLLRQLLAAQGLPTRTVQPGGISADLLDEVRVLFWDGPGAADAVSPAGVRTAEWVRRGGGLCVITGLAATPGAEGLGDVLPAVIPKPPPPPPPPNPPPSPEPPEKPPPDAPPKPREIEFVPVGIVLVIDKSGSMQGKKIRLAREAVIATLDTLAPRDRFGVLAFDEQSRWVLHPSKPVSRAEAIDKISRLAAGGGTNIYPAIMEARDALRDLPVGVRHVVLLSDGQDENTRDYRTLVESMAQRKITLSTIGVGEAFDSQLLSRLAEWGGSGEFDFTTSADRVPALVTAHARWAVDKARPPKKDGPETKPPETPEGPPPAPPEQPPDADPDQPETPDPLPLRTADAHPITARMGREGWPSVTTVRRIEAKPGALTLLEAVPPTAEARPAAVMGHAGDGRVLVLATDLNAEATAELGHWPQLSALIAQATRFLGPPPPPPAVVRAAIVFEHLPAAPQAPVAGHVTWSITGGPGDGQLAVTGSVAVGDAAYAPVDLRHTGTGRWEARFAAPAPGDTAICRAVLRTTAEPPEELMTADAATVRGPATEALDQPDPDALRALAAEGGGWFGPNDATIADLVPIPERPRSVAWWCYLLAGLLLLPVAWGQREE